jgi:Glucodextranase, domain B/S-layer homology domain
MRRVRVPVLAVAALVTLLTGPAWSGPNVWTEHGPPGGAIRSVFVDPSSTNTIYVGTIGSGVFKSTDGGATWVQKGLFGGFTVRALVRDATPPGTIYAGVENEPGAASGGVFSSVNGGDTWVALDNGLTNKKVQSLALDGSTLYAGTREEGTAPNVVAGGVFMWDGTLWHQLNTGLLPGDDECNSCPRRVQALATDSRHPGTIYAGTQGSGVYKSVNGGLNWTRWPNVTNQGWRSDCLLNPEIQALLVDETQAQETLYSGATGKVGNTGCDPTPASGGNQGQGPGFFRFISSDPQWDRKMNGMQNFLPTLTLNVWALAISGNRVYMGSDIGVLSSDDQAQSWDGVPRINPPPLPSGLLGPIRALAGFTSGTTTTLYAGTSGRGMFKRTHIGVPLGNQPWTEMNTGITALRALSVAVANQAGGSTILAGISGGGIVRSTDGGTTWQNTSEKERSARDIVVDPSDPSTAYAATGRGVYKSEDGGATWTPVNAGLPTEIVPEIAPGGPPAGPFTVPRTVRTIAADPVNPGVLYAAVQGVHASVDGGANWVPLNGNLPTTVTSGDGTVSAIVVNHSAGSHPVWGDLYLASDGTGVGAAGVFKSTDGGLSWGKVNSGIATQDQFITSLVPEPGSTTLYAGTSTGTVYRTSNGVNWVSVSAGLIPANPVTALAIELADPITIYAALNGSGVYVSSNGGFSWVSMSTGLNSFNVVGLALDATHTPHTLYAATLGRGMYDFQFSAANAPIVIIDSPTAPGSTTSPIAVTGTVLDDTGVSKVMWFTNRGHAGQATGTTSWSASVPLEPGSNVITITAVDTNSNEGSNSLTVDFTPPPNPPTVTITTPTANPTFATTTTPLAIGGTAADDTAVTAVTWTNSLGGSGTASGTTSWTASIPLQQGSNVITVTAHDTLGGTGTDVITVSFGTFADVPAGDIFFSFIEALAEAGITGGCSTTPPLYCPDTEVRRDQMAVFLLRGIHGAGYQPPAATGTKFTDVPLTQPFASWIEQLAREGITGGCSTSPPLYCPGTGVTRGQMAVFLLRAKYGAAYQPPAAQGMFTDVPLTQPFASWIEQLAREGITAGCGSTTYCPDTIATRGQMAVFLVRTFNLPM